MNNVRTRTRYIAITGVAALLLAVSACGGNSGGSGSGGESQNADVKFTGPPITVMSMASYDNDVYNVPESAQIEKGAVVAINNAGGINGHEVKLIVCNDQADPNKAGACAREAVDKKVSAVVSGFSAFGDSIMPILEKAGIAWFAPPGISGSELSSKYSFPISSGVLGMAGLGAKMIEDGCKTFAQVNLDQASSGSVAQLVNFGLASQGAAAAPLIKVPVTTTDYSSIAQQTGKYDCAELGLAPNYTNGLIAAGASQGIKTHYYVIPGGFTDANVKQLGSAADGVVTGDNFPPADSPKWDAAKKAVGDLADSTNGGWSALYLQNIWVGFQTFAKLLANNTDFSAKGVYTTLSQVSNVDTDGFTSTFSFGSEFPLPGLNRLFNHSLQFQKVDGDKLVADGDPVDLSTDLKF